MAGSVLTLLGEIIVDIAALVSVTNFIQHLAQITIFLLRRSRRIPQHTGCSNRVVLAHFQKVRNNFHGLIPFGMYAVSRIDTSQHVLQTTELTLVLNRFHTGIFFSDQLELLFGIIRHFVFGRIFSPVFVKIPSEALHPFVDFLSAYADGRTINCQRIRCCFCCCTYSHLTTPVYFIS